MTHTIEIDIPRPSTDGRIRHTVTGIYHPDDGTGAEFELITVDGKEPGWEDAITLELIELECLKQIEGHHEHTKIRRRTSVSAATAGFRKRDNTTMQTRWHDVTRLVCGDGPARA